MYFRSAWKIATCSDQSSLSAGMFHSKAQTVSRLWAGHKREKKLMFANAEYQRGQFFLIPFCCGHWGLLLEPPGFIKALFNVFLISLDTRNRSAMRAAPQEHLSSHQGRVFTNILKTASMFDLSLNKDRLGAIFYCPIVGGKGIPKWKITWVHDREKARSVHRLNMA